MEYIIEIERALQEVKQSTAEEVSQVINGRKFLGRDMAMKFLDCGKSKLQELKNNEEIRYTDTRPVMYEIDSLNEYLYRHLKGRGVVPKRRKRLQTNKSV